MMLSAATLRPVTPRDQQAVEAVVAAAFGGQVVGGVVPVVRALDASEATRASSVAIVDGQIVGLRDPVLQQIEEAGAAPAQ